MNLNLIPEIELALRGASTQLTLDLAEAWATKVNALEDEKIAVALIWLTNVEWLGSSKLTIPAAMRLLQDKWGVKPGWMTDSVLKRKPTYLMTRYRAKVPQSPQ